MNSFLKIFGFGKDQKKPDLGYHHENDFYPKFNYELNFLQALNKTPTSKLFGLNTYWENRYRELLGNLTPIIKNFLSSGLLKISLKEETLTIKELKEILKENDLPLSGNKEELAKRVFENVKNKSYSKNLDPFYKVTQEGKDQIEAYEQKFKRDFFKFIEFEIDVFLKGNIKIFKSHFFKVKKAFPDQRSFGGVDDNFEMLTENILSHLKEGKSFCQNWGFERDSELKIRGALAIQAAYFPYREEFVEKFLFDLDLSEFKKYLQDSFPNKTFSNSDLIHKFLRFEYNYLWNFYKFLECKEIQERRNDRLFKSILGVQILNNGCTCEDNLRIEKYTWKNIDKVPILPRTPLCTCIYNLFLEDEKDV